jgi:hypothetical protein
VEEIAIPREKLALFPPRAMGYGRTTESFRSKLGVAFDPFSAVETASDMTLRLLLHPQRASRLIAHKSIGKRQLGLVELLDELIAKTIKKSHDDYYYQELQNTINNTVLEQLFRLSTAKNQYSQVPAIVQSKLNEIKEYLTEKKSEGIQKIYEEAMVDKVARFMKNPIAFKETVVPKIPDGSPIGSEH